MGTPGPGLGNCGLLDYLLHLLQYLQYDVLLHVYNLVLRAHEIRDKILSKYFRSLPEKRGMLLDEFRNLTLLLKWFC